MSSTGPGLWYFTPGCPSQGRPPHPTQTLPPHARLPPAGTLSSLQAALLCGHPSPPIGGALTSGSDCCWGASSCFALSHLLVLGAHCWERKKKRKKSRNDIFLGRRKGTEPLRQTRVWKVEWGGQGGGGGGGAWRNTGSWNWLPVLGLVCIFEESPQIFLGWDCCHQPGASSNHFLLKNHPLAPDVFYAD